MESVVTPTSKYIIPLEAGHKEVKEVFINHLVGAVSTFWSSGNDLLKPLLDYLDKHGFYTAPSSTKYHEAWEGGLLFHSCKVNNVAHQLAGSEAFSSRFDSEKERAKITMAALLHDMCKMDRYDSYEDNYGNTKYTYNQNKPEPYGHGSTSMLLAARFLPDLPEDVLCAIRWHMGPWDKASMDDSDLGFANKTYPLVHLIQFADQVSITSWY